MSLAMSAAPSVVAVHRSHDHRFSKDEQASIRLLAGLGVEGDAHVGTTVQHLSRLRRDPEAPNLRQVHLLHAELLQSLAEAGYDVPPGSLGENVTTRGLDLLALPTGTLLHLGADAVVEVTGLRNPCVQIERYGEDHGGPGLLGRLVHTEDGETVRLAGVMGVVRTAGEVRPRDPVAVVVPQAAHRPLRPV